MIGIFESGSPGILIEGDYRCQPIYLSQRLHDEPRTSSRAAVEKRVSLPQLFHQLLSVVAGRSRLQAPAQDGLQIQRSQGSSRRRSL